MEALDRFAGFFTEPLLTRDCTLREINAALGPSKASAKLQQSFSEALVIIPRWTPNTKRVSPPPGGATSGAFLGAHELS